ncbi:MAG: GTP-binding protein Era [Frankiales bacterium]|nr:GTP-binding protein Era [Frankiales bacterium]
MSTPTQNTFRSGFCAFVGRPNAGKSTLTNALVGTKIVITSDKPQTTRRAVRGVLSRPDGQLVIVDTPGLHKPQNLLGERLNDLVRDTLADVDVIGFCVTADQKVGPGDRYIAQQLRGFRPPVIAVVTKVDRASRTQVAEQLLAVSRLGDFAEVIPVSALAARTDSSSNVGLLADLLMARLPEGPQLYDADTDTDETTEARIAELIRESALVGVRDELPHSIAVTVEELHPRADNPELIEVFATLHLERSSQKPIILGRGGQGLKIIGTRARHNIEALLGQRVYLDLHVSVIGEWQRDAKKLDRLGF